MKNNDKKQLNKSLTHLQSKLISVENYYKKLIDNEDFENYFDAIENITELRITINKSIADFQDKLDGMGLLINI